MKKTIDWQVRVEVYRCEDSPMSRRLTNAVTFALDDQSKLEPLFRVVSALLGNPSHFSGVGAVQLEFVDDWLPVNIGE